MWSRMNSFHVSAEIGFEPVRSLSIIWRELHRSTITSTTTGKLVIVDPINVQLTDTNLPSMLPYKKSQGHILLL